MPNFIIAILLTGAVSASGQPSQPRLGKPDGDIEVVVNRPDSFSKNGETESIEVLKNGETLLRYSAMVFYQGLVKTESIPPASGWYVEFGPHRGPIYCDS